MKPTHIGPEEMEAMLERSFSGEPPADVEQSLLDVTRRYARDLPGSDWSNKGTPRGWKSRQTAVWGGIAALIALSFAVWFFVTPGRVPQAFAKAIEALEGVRILHVSGIGTASLFRGHEEVPAADRYDIEGWVWFAADGSYREYLREGPIVEWDDGELRYRYNEHTDRLRVDRSRFNRQRQPREHLLRSRMEERLGATTGRNSVFEDMGVVERQGRNVHIIRKELREGKRKEWWFDVETQLLVHETRHKWRNGEWALHWSLELTYDEAVPAEIAGYSVPNAEHIEYSDSVDPEFEPWRRHLLQLATRYQDGNLPGLMEVVPWRSGERLERYSRAPLPGYSDYSVEPVSRSLGDYFMGNDAVALGGSIRIPKELRTLRLNLDIVFRTRVGEEIDATRRLAAATSKTARAALLLDHLGLEMVETEASRPVWVAQYDGRKLKPWREVKAPFERGHEGPGRACQWRSGGGFTLRADVFRLFNWQQDCQLTGRSVAIVDETGIPEDLEVCSELADFHGCHGEAGREVAKRWFAEEFGITFREEVRPVELQVVRRKS